MVIHMYNMPLMCWYFNKNYLWFKITFVSSLNNCISTHFVTTVTPEKIHIVIVFTLSVIFHYLESCKKFFAQKEFAFVWFLMVATSNHKQFLLFEYSMDYFDFNFSMSAIPTSVIPISDIPTSAIPISAIFHFIHCHFSPTLPNCVA